jgi:hypothetical protein
VISQIENETHMTFETVSDITGTASSLKTIEEYDFQGAFCGVEKTMGSYTFPRRPF